VRGEFPKAAVELQSDSGSLRLHLRAGSSTAWPLLRRVHFAQDDKLNQSQKPRAGRPRHDGAVSQNAGHFPPIAVGLVTRRSGTAMRRESTPRRTP